MFHVYGEYQDHKKTSYDRSKHFLIKAWKVMPHTHLNSQMRLAKVMKLLTLVSTFLSVPFTNTVTLLIIALHFEYECKS